MKITKEAFKNIVRETMIEENEYQQFFKKALEKTGKSIPDMSDEEKKAFFNKIDAAWQGKGEKNEELVGNQAKLDVDGDGEIEASDLAALRAGKKVNEATLEKGTKLRYDKNSNVVDYVVDKKYIGRDGYPRYILKVVTSNTKNIKVGSTIEYDDARLTGLIRNRVMTFVKNESVDEATNLKTIAMLLQNKGIRDAVRKDHADKLRKIIEDGGVSTKGVSDSELIKVVKQLTSESVDEASKPTIKVVTKLKPEQGIQIVVTKTTKGETMYGGFVVRGKLQKVIPVGANNSKEGVQKRALQIWDEFGKQLGESKSVNEEILKPGTKVKVQHKGKTVSGKIVRYDSKTPGSPFYVVYTGQYDSIEVPAYQVKKESVTEGKLSDTWRKNNKKGYILKVGNIELKSAGPSNTHDIYKNGYMWGKFHMDYESGGTDWWVEPSKGSDFYVKTIDDIVKKVKADSRFNESVKGLTDNNFC